MTPEEIQAFAQGLISGQSFWYVLTPVVGAASAYWGAHLAEKGKNRATKEDIGEITKAVGKVNAEFNEKLEELKAHHQLRMVAAERRLQAHQEAYVWWQKLWQATVAEKKDELDEHVEALKLWYFKNCIFLGKKTRLACMDAIGASLGYFCLIAQRPDVKYLQLTQTLAKLEGVAAIILSEVDLPTMQADEMQAHRMLLSDTPR